MGRLFTASTRHTNNADKVERNKESLKKVQQDKIENAAGSV
jgi:hypothetical protein